MRLKKNIYNIMNRKQVYAHAGDEVTLIGSSVLVMAKKDGSKFTVRAEDLEEFVKEDKPKKAPEDPVVPEKKPLFTEPPHESGKIKKPQDPLTLF